MFGSTLQFWQPNYKSDLVYCSDVPKGQVVESAFEAAASDTRHLTEAATVLRREIMNAFTKAQSCHAMASFCKPTF